MASEQQRPGPAEGRRSEILEAALRVIGAGGPDAITHRRVAAEAGVPLGSLTYYFESRVDLVREAFRHYLQRSRHALSSLEDEIPPTSAQDLIDMLVELVRREFVEPAVLRAEYEMILYAGRDEGISHEFIAWERQTEAQLATNLEALGAIRPMAAARTIVELVRGFEIERLARPGDAHDDLRTRLGFVVNALVGAGAASSPRPATSFGIKPKSKRPRRERRTGAIGSTTRRTVE